MFQKLLILLLAVVYLNGSEIIKAKGEFEKKNYKKAYKQFKQIAQSGMIAKYNLGLMNELGLGVKKDRKKAIKFYHMSANDGFDKAQFALGNAYFHGVGVKQNRLLAVKYYQLAANQNNKEAKSVLSKIKHIVKDLKKDWPTVTVRSNVSKDKVYLNGQLVGQTKIDLKLEPNRVHKIEVHKKGYEPYQFKDIFMKPKEKRTIRAYLKKI